MFKKALAAIGIGGLKVETILDNPDVTVGGTLTGTIQIQGGSVPQQVNNIILEIITMVEREVDDQRQRFPVVLERFATNLSGSFDPGERQDVPFEIPVPLNTPIFLKGADIRVWLRTRLEIPGAADPTDDDVLRAHPVDEMHAVFEAMDRLGFYLYKSDVEYRRFDPGFMQEFEFKPARRGTGFDEVEVVFQPHQNGIDLLVQVDRSARGWVGYWAEAHGFDESWHRVTVPFGTGVDAIEEALRRTLR